MIKLMQGQKKSTRIVVFPLSKGCWALPDCFRQRMPSSHPLAWLRTRYRWGNIFCRSIARSWSLKSSSDTKYLPELQGVRIGTQERSLGPIELK